MVEDTTFGKVAAHWLRESESVLHLCMSREGRVRSWNPAIPRRLGREEEDLGTLQLRALLAEGEAERILQVAAGNDADTPRMVNFVDAEQAPITLSCRLYPEGDAVHIVGTDLVGERSVAPRILVGGGAFRADPEAWREIGADGFGRDLRDALERARELEFVGERHRMPEP